MTPLDTNRGSSFADLVAGARLGDAAALDRLFDRLREYMALVAREELGRELRCKVRGSDIVQETLLKAYRHFAAFRGVTEDEFRCWAVTLVKRTVVDASRTYQRSKSRDLRRELPLDSVPEPVGHCGSASSLLQRCEADEQLLRAVEGLAARHRQVIELRHRRGLRFAEIAAIMNLTPDATRQLWTRAVEALRSRVADA